MKNNHLSIKDWSEQDRPREKLSTLGHKNLTDAELLAIIIGSGNRNESAVSLAQKIINSVQGNLHDLGKLDLNALMKFKGIGEAKAISIIAALELGLRRQSSIVVSRPRFNSSSDAFDLMSPIVNDLPVEEFWVILLNRNNSMIAKKRISIGGVAATVVDPKVIYKIALEVLACSIVLVHNHPSDNLRPSQADMSITRKLVAAGKSLDIRVLDHIIIGSSGYYSFADHGVL